MSSLHSDRTAISSMVLISAFIFLFLFWLLYLHEPVSGENSLNVGFIPSLNAFFNTICAVCLAIGFWAIRCQKKELHRRMMLSALVFSSVFLVCYLVYHTFHGDTPFHGEGWIRPIYFFILISHVVFSAVMLPLIMITLYFALTGKLTLHPKVARFTLPIWFYVSVTGVLVYIMLHQLQFSQV